MESGTWPDRALLRRLPAAAALGALLLAFPILERKLGGARGGSDVTFLLAFGSALLGLLAAVVRPERSLLPLLSAARETPVRTVVLLANLVVVALLLTNVVGKGGVTLLLGVGGLALLALGLAPAASAGRAISQLVRESAISFATVYLLLGGLEVVLRFHPEKVGGGGGGNPALPRLYAGLATVNADGFRGAEIGRRREEVVRIVMLGDSFTFGQGVADDETYPARVERLLAGRRDGRHYEVLNGGVSGTGMEDHVARLEEKGWALEPDLVTVQFYLNDLLPRVEDAGAGEGAIEDVLFGLRRRSYALFFVADRLRALGRGGDRKPDFVEQLARRLATDPAAWTGFDAAVAALERHRRRRDVPVAVVLFPHPIAPDGAMAEIHRSVAARVRAAGLPVIDLLDAFQELEPGERVVSSIDHHPSVAAHAIAAAEVVAGLEALDLLPPPDAAAAPE